MIHIPVTQQLSVVPVACLQDNYAYLVFDPTADGDCLVVDPSEAGPVRDEVKRRGLQLRAILTTHHHWDHVGGNLELKAEGVQEVIAHSSEESRVPGFTRGVAHGEASRVLGWEFRALHIPGHTAGAVAFVFDEICFTGDTLFCGGCGRLSEGTPAQMQHSLCEVLGELSGDMQIYCGHEYTQRNLEFAHGIWKHEALGSRLADVRIRRARGDYCATATLRTERATNPFLLCDRPELQRALKQSDAAGAFAELRRLKDAY